tara:strand:+ start:8225 stop:9022 length:798 start_codon:yes stop_codon:yes gene_type:complete
MITKVLPTDVERYILEYLTMPLDIKSLKKVSKTIKKTVINMPTFIEKNRITDKVFMMSEDILFKKYRNNIHSIVLSSLADKWNEYNKWAWIRPKKNSVSNYYSIGDFVDVLDKVNVWGPAYIKDIMLEPVQDPFVETRRLYLVEFLGWSNIFDEWIPIEKIKALGSQTYNPTTSYECLNIQNDHWILYNDPLLGWRISICKKIMKLNNTNSLQITIQQLYDSTNIQYVTINKYNINNYIKPINNISAFLCDTNKILDINNKKVLY